MALPTTKLSSIIRDLARRASDGRLGAADFNFDGMTDYDVRGVLIKEPTTSRDVIDTLRRVYLFDGVESGFKIKCITRGVMESTIEIPEEDFGVGRDSPVKDEIVKINRASELDLPREVRYSGMNQDRDYWDISRNAWRENVNTNEKMFLNTSMVVSPEEIERAVHVGLAIIWMERDVYTATILPEWTHLEPGDIIKFTRNGKEFLGRVSLNELTLEGPIVVEAIRHLPGVVDFAPAIIDGPGVDQNLTAPAIPEFHFLDIPLLADTDDDPGFYIAASKDNPSKSWSFARVYFAPVDDNAAYEEIKSIDLPAKWGYLGSTMGPGTTRGLEPFEVTVLMVDGTPESIAISSLQFNKNAVYIDGELAQFTTASLQADGTYKLSGWLRGRHSTEESEGAHTANVFATLTTGSVPSNNAIKWTSKAYGATGNNINIKVVLNFFGVEPGEIVVDLPNSDLSLVNITVNANKFNDVYTAQEVIDLVNADPISSGFVFAENASGSDGSGDMTAVSSTPLTGGVDGSKIIWLEGPSYINRVNRGAADIGLTRYMKVVHSTQDPDDISGVAIVNNAAGLKPWSPIDIRGSRGVPLADDLNISWVRRTRFGGRPGATSGAIPLNEGGGEEYEVDIMNGMSVVRTISNIIPTFTDPFRPDTVYTAAQQTTDFGSPQNPITVRVYQISATVGRGFKGEASI